MNSNVTSFRQLRHVSLLWAAPERSKEVADIHRQLFNPPWTADAIASLLAHPASTSLIAVSGSPHAIAGFVIGQLAADEAEILSIGVMPDWQRIGLGAMLVEGIARAARRGEARTLFLEVAEDNSAALRLYQRLGFREVGRRPRYYHRPDGPAIDALNLSLDLAHGA